MFRLWLKIFSDNHLLKDATIEDKTADTRTHKVMRALEEGCRLFDLGHPLWLEKNVRDFRKHARVRFTQDNFIEEIEFDYLEIRVIEED